MTVHILGIRHHGPGSARSLRAALEELRPDAVLIEGPPDADKLIPLVAHDDMEPPVALLIYAPDDTRQAVYYPFAVFSPEFQAMDWALRNAVHVQFMDLPQTHQFALRAAQESEAYVDEPETGEEVEEVEIEIEDEGTLTIVEDPDAKSEPSIEEPDIAELVQRDPLGWLGRAAGYNDGERWWEHIIEQRRDDLQGVFEAVLEAMSVLRETAGAVTDEREAQREAYMRKTIRAAQKAGYQNIAVVCGAWHGPALQEGNDLYQTAKADNDLLKNMPKLKVEATWIPWTYGRISRDSGYGAGIESPGWYHHLWTTDDEVVIRWLTKVAALLRGEDLDASTAQVIDTVRLVESLTAIRGYALPGLEELNESIQATMTFGASAPMELIRQELIVSDRMGDVPPETPMVPLQRDLRETVKRLKGGRSKKNGSYFQQHSEETPLNLDLRTPLHLERSQLLHRLRILNVDWGKPKRGNSGRGTFHENWTLQWLPEFEIRLIEHSIWGNTIPDAATNFVIDRAENAKTLPELTKLVDKVLNADLPQAFDRLIAQLQAKAAVASDVSHLMDALPPLVYVKYGNVRGFDLSDLTTVIDGLVTRINISLVNACSSLDDDAAEGMFKRLEAVHDAITRLNDEDHTANWLHALKRLAGGTTIHGLVAGRAARLLLDAHQLTVEEAATLLRLAISTAVSPPAAAAWVEGFLRNSGLILLHDDALFRVIDQWLMSLQEQAFVSLLPLLRRTYSTFAGPERRQLGERVRMTTLGTDDDPIAAPTPAGTATALDEERADGVLPIVAQLLGLDDTE